MLKHKQLNFLDLVLIVQNLFPEQFCIILKLTQNQFVALPLDLEVVSGATEICVGRFQAECW
jgi:hypothetical protein